MASDIPRVDRRERQRWLDAGPDPFRIRRTTTHFAEAPEYLRRPASSAVQAP